MLINRNYNNTIYQLPLINDTQASQISGIGITSNGLNVFLGIQSRILVFNLQQGNKEMAILSNSSTYGSTVTQFIFNSNETFIVALTTSQLIQFYDISNLQNISLAGEFITNSNLNLRVALSAYDNLLYVAAGYNGFNIYSLEYSFNEKSVIEYSLIYQNQPGNNIVDLAWSQNSHVIYAVDFVQGIFIFNNLNSLDQIKTQSNCKHFGLGGFQIKFQTSSIAISEFDLFIYVGVRSQGVYIFNIENDAMNPVFFQLVQCLGNPLKILAYSNLNGIIISDSLSIKIYSQKMPNINENTPNLLNIHKKQQIEIGNFTQNGKCLMHKPSNLIYGPFNKNSIKLIQYQSSYFNQSNNQNQNSYSSFTNFLPIFNSTYYLNILNLSDSQIADYLVTSDQRMMILLKGKKQQVLILNLLPNSSSKRLISANNQLSQYLNLYQEQGDLNLLWGRKLEINKKLEAKKQSNNTFKLYDQGEGKVKKLTLKQELNTIQKKEKKTSRFYFAFNEQNKQFNSHIFHSNIRNALIKFKSKNKQKRILETQQIQKLINFDYQDESLSIDINKEETLLLFSKLSGFYLIETNNYQVITNFTLTNITSLCKSAFFSPNGKYILLIYQNNGLYFIDIQNQEHPFVANYYQTSLGEQIISSKISEYIYFIDGINGLIIIDENYLPTIKIVGNYQNSKWLSHLDLSIDENYGVISSIDQNEMIIVNLQIKSNPQLVSAQYLDKQQVQIYYSCLDLNQQLLFAVGKNGIYSYPTSSNLVIDVQLLSVTEKQNLFFIQENNFFDDLISSFNINKSFLKVGLYYQFELIPIYKQENQILQEIFILKNNQLKKLPAWINATEDFKNLTIFVSKELLQQGQSQGSMTLVIKNCFQLRQSDLLISLSMLNLTELENQAIWSFLINNKIINRDFCYNEEKDYTLSEKALQLFDLLKSISDSNSYNRTMLILSNVQQILNQSIDYSPIKFNIESSLKFDIDDSLNVIQSQLNSQITLVLSFEQNSNLIFVNMNYQNSLIFLYGQQSNTISLQSTTQNLNQILQGKIYFYLDITDDGNNNNNSQNDQNLANELIQIQLSDGINYDVQINVNLNQAHFLQLKRDIKLINPLQKQVNFLSDGASFAIETQLSIEFEQTTFIDPDFNSLNSTQNGIDKISVTNDLSVVYEFYLMNQGGEYDLVSSNYFLKFDSQNMRLIGSPPSSLLFQQQNYMIIAKTVYCQAQDTFYLKFDQIPLSFVFNIFLKIISPIAFFIGIYQKRHIFYNIINKKKTLYSQEKAYIYQIYRKKITLIGDELILTQLFFEKFLKIIGQPTSQLYKEIIGDYNFSNLTNLNYEFQNQSLNASQQQQQFEDVQIQMYNHQHLQKDIKNESQNTQKWIGFQHDSNNLDTNDKIQNEEISALTKKRVILKQQVGLKSNRQNQIENGKIFCSLSLIQNSIFDQKDSDSNETQQHHFLSQNQIKVDGHECQDIVNQKQINHQSQQQLNQQIINYTNQDKKELKLNENMQQFELNKNKTHQDLKSAIKILHSNKNMVEEANKQFDKQFQVKRSKSLIKRIKELKKSNQIDLDQEKKIAYSARCIIKKLCLKENGKINIHQVIYYMLKKELEVVLRLKKERVLEYKDEFENQNSRFFYSLKAFIARYLLQGDSKSKYLYKFLRNSAINNKLSQNTPNDWYKNYVEIIPTNDIDDLGMCIPFSKTKIKIVYLKNILQQLQLFKIENFTQTRDKKLFNYLERGGSDVDDEEELQQQLKKFKINFYLVKEVLIADALGLVFEKEHFSSQKCFGESLHIHNEQILSIEAFQTIKTSKVMWLRKICNLMYSRIPISKHLSLPTWISFDCKNGVIYLEGTPSHQDVHDILIRIYDISKQIILQYNLSIQDEKKRSKNSIKLLIQSFNPNSIISSKNNNQQNQMIKQSIVSQINDNSQISYSQKSQNYSPNSSLGFIQKVSDINNYFDPSSCLRIKQQAQIQNLTNDQAQEQKEKQISEVFKQTNKLQSSSESSVLKQCDSFSTYASPKNTSHSMLNNTKYKQINKKTLHKQSSFKTEYQQQTCYENYLEQNIQVPSSDKLDVQVPDSLKIKNHNKNISFIKQNQIADN
ncbi:hypothetical protein ABPG74_016160 [Tetrahymena malaccensis]